MSTLENLLQVLERADVSEVRLQSGSAAAASRNGGYVPLTKVALSAEQIGGILQGTSVQGALAGDADVRAELALVLGGRGYAVNVMRAAGRVQVRFRVASGEGGDGGVVAPAGGVAHGSPGGSGGVLAPAGGVAHGSPGGSGGVVAPAGAVALGSPAGAGGIDQQARTALAQLLAQARALLVSDVHIAGGQPVRLRRAGELTASGPPLPAATVEAMLRSVLQPAHVAALAAQGYADLSVELPKAGRMRVNVGMQGGGLKGCFRLIGATLPTLESLGLPAELANVANYHQGLAIISGPNGQGKTTTMAAICNLINMQSPHHVITVEDPVEYLHPVGRALMSQREVGAHTASFARALKAALREDPDVIVIGELRDRETVEIALAAAETGHLVIATMSTRSAAKTIDRLIDLFPAELQPQVRATLAGALKVVVSQRLLPATAAGTMVAAAELITGSVPLWNLIRENKLVQLPSLMQRGRGLGMIRFDTSLQELVLAGRLGEDVARRAAEQPQEFERSLRAAQAAAPAASRPARRDA